MKRKMTHAGLAGIGLGLLLGAACSKKDEDRSARSPERQMTPAAGEERTRRPIQSAPNAPPPSVEEPEAPATWGSDESPGVRNLEPHELETEGAEAKAEFKTVKGSNLKGNAEFEEIPGGVRIKVEVENAPAGMKGLHIHEKGNCSNIAGKSMGEHFNPMKHEHGMPQGSGERHLGDLGNLEIDAEGEGELTITVMGANLKPNDPMSYLGRAIVIHESKDVGAQPSGGAGKPMACGVIKKE